LLGQAGGCGEPADELLMNDRRRYADKRPDAVRLWDVVMRQWLSYITTKT
jgi:hypothetical protein